MPKDPPPASPHDSTRLGRLSAVSMWLLPTSTVAVGALATVYFREQLQASISLLLFVPAIVVAAFFGGYPGGVVAAVLSELVSSLLLSASPVSWIAVSIRLAVFLSIAMIVARLSAQRREDLGTLEQRVAARTADLEAANRALTAEIAQRTELERRLEYLADHDPLTGLLNRRRFENTLAEAIAFEARYRSGGAVLLIDLDHFKEVNDSEGHQAGDQLLRTVGEIVEGCVRQTDTVARLGGDEFGVLLRHVTAEQAGSIADAIVKAIRRHLALGGRAIPVTASVGLTMLEGATLQQVLARADLAMYQAKQAGRDTFVTHVTPPSGEQLPTGRLTERERVRQIIDERRFVLYCQPIVDLERARVSQYELLLRMLDDQNRPMSPSAFLTIAERLGLVPLIDSWVVTEAVGLVADQARAGRAVTLHVNISGQTVSDPALVDAIDRTLEETGVDPGRLVFELTETAAIANLEEARTFAEQLRRRGCQFALDDFGTGFGSFSYLKHIPFDYLKIDGDFVRGFMNNPTDMLVIKAIVGIARGMGKKSVAEFVAGADVAERLRLTGVDYAQGYELGAPQPVTQVFGRVN